MRTVFLAAALALVLGAPAAFAQDPNEQRTFCANAENTFAPDLQIGGCTALIQSGSEPTESLATAFYSRSNALLRQDEYARAIADADQAALLAPRNASYQNFRCWTRAVAGRELEVARAACNRAIELTPQDQDFFDSRGLVGLKQARWLNAWSDYDTALRLAPDTAHFLHGRGVAAFGLGRTAEGQADIASAAALDASVAQAYLGYGVTWPGSPASPRRAAVAASPTTTPTTTTASTPRREERRSTTCRPRLNNRC